MRDATETRAALTERGALRGASRARLAAWLLEGPAQLRDGPHAGAVAGVVASGSPAYVYPEITGYYLQWLAHRAWCGDDARVLRARAQAAQAWLHRWAADERPLARVHLEPREDWRNAALFTFDVAMVLRGLAGAADAGLLSVHPRLVVRLDALLCGLIGDDGALDACHPHHPRASLPARWSTARGAFLAKAAAGVLGASHLPGMSSALLDAAQRTYDLARSQVRTHAHAEAHPRLYALEGLLAREGRAAFLEHAAVSQVRDLIDCATARGCIPESTHHAGQPRLDVHAQALRVATLMCAFDVPRAPQYSSLAAMADGLAGRVTPAGGVPFAAAAGGAELNVWTAMFAEQALAWIDLPAAALARACTLIV
jgi:hypothetical protein